MDESASASSYGPPRPGENGDATAAAAPPTTEKSDKSSSRSERSEKDRDRDRSDRDRDRHRDKDRDRDRDRERKDRDKERDRERDKDKDKDKDKDRDRERDKDKDKDKDRERDKDRSERRERDRERRRSRSRDKSAERKRSRTERSRSPKRDTGPKVTPLDKRERRIILWDISPVGCEGMTPQQVKAMGIFPTPGQPSVPGHHGADPARGLFGGGYDDSMMMALPIPQRAMLPMPILPVAASTPADQANTHQTRQQKRLYVGNIPFGTNENDLMTFFNQTLSQAKISSLPGNPVVSCTINHDKNFSFLEFRNPDEATNSMAFDGVTYQGATLRIKRPKDYVAPSGSGSVMESPYRIAINGLPLYFNDEQVKELLSAFGELKFFQLNKDSASGESKGSATCEYADSSLTDLAVQGLDGMQIGEGKLQVYRIAISMSAMPTLPNGEANPTRILQLLNMVTEEELVDDEEYEDICDDVKDECRKFGPVKSVMIPRPIKGQTVGGVGKIFVEFESTGGSAAAFTALAGRKFASRTVVTSFYDEEKYLQRDFD